MNAPTEENLAELKKRRRSERLYLTIPIRIFGTDPNARDFFEDALTMAVSRHGARIRIQNQVVADEEIHITNLSNNREDTFRVVGQVSPPRPGNPFSDWGVECLHPEINIWGMEFKDSAEDAGAASALLECCACSSVVSVELTHEELDTLAASQLLSRSCSRCRQSTFWKPASTDRRQHEAAPVVQALTSAGLPQQTRTDSPTSVPAPGVERRQGEDRRQERRLAVRVPIRVRAPDGSVEVTKTENLSKTGARFFSEKEYAKEANLFVAAPYTPGEEPLETKAVVEEIEDLPGSVGKLYGVRFESKSARR